MELSSDAMLCFNQAFSYATDKGFEFVTPELLLMMLCEDDSFEYAFTECGGNIQLLVQDLTEYMEQYVEKDNQDNPQLSYNMQMLMNFAGQSAYNSGSDKIYIRHLVHALWYLQECYAVYFMQKQGIAEIDLLQEFAFVDDGDLPFGGDEEGMDDFSEDRNAETEKFSIEMFAPCLNDTLTDVNPLIGRVDELERTIQILCRKDKNNPLHIGEPGVGKTAITYGLVEKIRNGEVPEALAGAKVYALDLGGMLAGTQYRGDFEKRFKKVLNEISKEEKPIIYIDEIHNLSGAGATSGGSLDASNMLKPYLSDGHIRFIGATTFEEYKKYFEKNKSLVRRFQNVEIKEPSEEETIEILEGLKSKYEKFHGVKFAKGLMSYAVHMSAKHINERYLPDKAIDLIDEAGSYRKLHPTEKKTQTGATIGNIRESVFT